MTKSAKIAAATLATLVLAFVLAPAGRVLADGIQQVFVTNFPDRYDVQGTVSVKGPIRTGVLAAKRDLIVSPVSPKDTMRLIDGGTIECDGFANMVLSMTGQIKGEVYRAGTVGAMLIPDEEPIVRAFEEKSQAQFMLEITAASVSGASPYFFSNQPRFQIGFPRYRVYLYNTADKTVTVNLYAYLTN